MGSYSERLALQQLIVPLQLLSIFSTLVQLDLVQICLLELKITCLAQSLPIPLESHKLPPSSYTALGGEYTVLDLQLAQSTCHCADQHVDGG